MYPAKITDMPSLHACLDRMYDDYVVHCKRLGGGDFVFSRSEWKDMLRLLGPDMVAQLVHNFNTHELSLLNN